MISIINMAAITTTKPIAPVVIFLLASSNAPLSPPEEMMPIAPVIRMNMKKSAATTVSRPIVVDKTCASTTTAFVPWPMFPMPLKGVVRGFSLWAIKFLIAD